MRDKLESEVYNSKIFQWLKSDNMIFYDSDYIFIKYPYSENLDLIYGNYLSYVGIGSSLKYAGIYDKEKNVLFAIDYNLKNALKLSWDDKIFKDLSELELGLISKLNTCINDYVYQNKEEFYKAVNDYKGYVDVSDIESDFIRGKTNYKYNTNISKISKEDILKYLDHEEYVFDWAFDYIQKNKKYIGENLKDNDVKNEYLTSILNNKNHPLHKAREIRISLEKIAASTVHVYIYKNDIAFDFKYDKTSLMNSVSNSYISTYNMSASDRREYEKQFGKYTDFNFNDIYKIEYRNKPIYVDRNYENSLKKEYTL